MSRVSPDQRGATGTVEVEAHPTGILLPDDRRTHQRGRARLAALLRRPTFVVSAAILLGWIAAAVLWPMLGTNPYSNTGIVLAPPSFTQPFGTDGLGRSVFARVLAGARPALTVGVLGSLLATVLGAALGLVAGYFRGWVDTALVRLFDVLVVLPPLIFLIVLAGAFGVTPAALIVIIGVVFAPGIARIVRAATLAEMGKSYVESAQLQHESAWRIVLRELAPNVFPTVIVQATLSLAAAVFLSASLSFLGLGTHPPSPDWGLQINENRVYLQSAWWTVVFPAAALASLVVAVHLVSDNLKEVWR